MDEVNPCACPEREVDMVCYGIHACKDGKRIAPEDLYVEPTDEVKLLPCNCPFCGTVISQHMTRRNEPYWKHPLSGCLLSRFILDPDKIPAWNTRAIEATRPTEQSLGAIPGSHPADQAPSGLGASRFDPERSKWRFDALPFDKRPMRQFVWISGERYHSGLRWRRDHWGLAYIRPDGSGYRDEDITRLEHEGDMDAGTAEIYGWLPANTPAFFDMDRCEAIEVNAPASAIPKGRDREYWRGSRERGPAGRRT